MDAEVAVAVPPSHSDSSADELYRIFNHVDLPLGSDGTPCAYYEALRDVALTTPVGRSEALGGFWVVASHETIRDVMRRPEEFSSAAVIWPPYNTGSDQPLMIAGQDNPVHRAYRSLVQSRFSPKAVPAYHEPLRRMTNEIIDSFIETGRCELSNVLADEIPARLTACFLGLDENESATYRGWVEVMAHGLPDADSTMQVMGEMQAHFLDSIAQARRKPGDNVLSHLTQVELDGEPLSEEDLVAFCALLLLGGVHNSAKLLSNAFWRLAWDVELRRRLVAHPERIPSAIEEFLRYYTPASVGRLVSVDETEVAGVKMNKGDIVMLALPVANRDPRAFDHPDVFVLDRQPNDHLGLGHGIHGCLGAHLLRVEAREVFTEFLRRIPRFELDSSGKQPHWQLGQTSGMTDVVLKFPPGRAS